MIQIDSAMLGIIITVLISLLGLAAALGALWQRDKGQDKTIEDNRLQIEKTVEDHRRMREMAIERLHTENREDHRQIFGQLAEINMTLRNGGSKHGEPE